VNNSGGFRWPQTDHNDATDLMVRTIRGEVRPVSAFRELPLFWSAACQVTDHPPIDEAFRLVHEVERRPNRILSVTLATGFPRADIPQIGASVVVAADGNAQLTRSTTDEIGDWIWQNRDRFHRKPLSLTEALEHGEREGRFPIMLADMADNTGGGAGRDSTEVLSTFVERKRTSWITPSSHRRRKRASCNKMLGLSRYAGTSGTKICAVPYSSARVRIASNAKVWLPHRAASSQYCCT